MTFRTWCTTQRHRNDPIGDIARDILADTTFPNMDTEGAWRRHLQQHNASDEALEALHEAYHAYEQDTGIFHVLTLEDVTEGYIL